VGADGETHQGIFDLSYLGMMPNMTVMAPKNKWELADMLRFALRMDSPVAIRYPRGQAYDGLKEYRAPVEYGKSEWIYEEIQIALIAVGNMVETALRVHEMLHEKGFDCSLINARFVKPVDEEMILKAAKGHLLIVTIEENVLQGGFGSAVEACLNQTKETVCLLKCGINDQFVEQGSVPQLHERIGLDAESITEKIIAAYEEI
jgi:1-deoxy-D-xylulose-5-phosphate synthase